MLSSHGAPPSPPPPPFQTLPPSLMHSGVTEELIASTPAGNREHRINAACGHAVADSCCVLQVDAFMFAAPNIDSMHSMKVCSPSSQPDKNMYVTLALQSHSAVTLSCHTHASHRCVGLSKHRWIHWGVCDADS